MKQNSELRTRRKALVLGDDVRSLIAVIRSLGRAGIEVHSAGHDSRSPAARSRFVHRVHTLPGYSEDGKWLRAISDLMRNEQFDLVIPCSDPQQIPLQQHRHTLEPLGKIYLLQDDVFQIVSDKNSMNNLARRAGLHVPIERVVCSVEDALKIKNEFSLPVVLKPRSSFDLTNIGPRRKVSKAYTWDQYGSLIDEMLRQGPVTIQENFVGRGVGVELLLDRGRPLLIFQHVRLHEPLHGGGSYYRRGVQVDPVLLEASLSLLTPLAYTGVAMVEFKVNPKTNEWVFIEVNARFWGSLPLAVASGADFPKALFQLLVSDPVDVPMQARTGLCCRYWTGDIRWQIGNIRANRSDPTLATVPLLEIIKESTLNPLTFRERSDTFTLDDPLPGLTEVSQIVISLFRGGFRKVHRKVLQSGPMRRRLLKTSRRALAGAKSVVFVCYGNICRSPFAERVATKRFGKTKTILSAGYHEQSGRRSPQCAAVAADAKGLDLSTHRSVVLTREIIQGADAVFVFDYSNYENVLERFPEARRKIHFVGAMCLGGELWIRDPYGGSADVFSNVYERIAQAILAGSKC